MSIGLDTSVVLRLLTGMPEEQAECARAELAHERDPAAVSDLVVAETYFALRHHYSVPHAEAVKALDALLADARVHSSGVALRVLADPSTRVPKPRPGVVDRLIHAEYRRDALDVMTFDRDLARLPGVRMLRGT
jgi:predicted nucleic acid-binding protein